MLRKDLSRDQIERAMRNTLSNRAAARYLNVSQPHYRMWAKRYESHKEGFETLFDEHLNQIGKGIPKFLTNQGKEHPLLDIIEGRIDVSSFTPEKIKFRLVSEGYLLEECYNCGMNERRVVDYKIPLILHFKDGNKKNYRKENIEFLCYNCFFLLIGDIFTNKQIKGLEDHKPVNTKGDATFDLDPYMLQRLKELGLGEDEPPNDGSEFVNYSI